MAPSRVVPTFNQVNAARRAAGLGLRPTSESIVLLGDAIDEINLALHRHSQADGRSRAQDARRHA